MGRLVRPIFLSWLGARDAEPEEGPLDVDACTPALATGRQELAARCADKRTNLLDGVFDVEIRKRVGNHAPRDKLP